MGPLTRTRAAALTLALLLAGCGPPPDPAPPEPPRVISLLGELEQSSGGLPSRWHTRGSRNFRVHYLQFPEVAGLIVESAEQSRRELLQRWGLPWRRAWSPPCDVFFFPSTAVMDRMTVGTTTTASAHAPASRLVKGRLLYRKLKLAADDRGLLEDSIPHELSHLIVSGLLAPRRPPLWANEGLAMLAESPRSQRRRARALLYRVASGRPLFPLSVLFGLRQYPDQRRLFYTQSFAVTRVLWQQRGTAILAFLRDGGDLPALARHYGLDPAGLRRAVLLEMRRLATAR